MRHVRRINEELFLKPEEEAIWKQELKKVGKCPQRQDSLTDQMVDLALIADKFGFYDAADYIRSNFKK